MSPTLKVKTPAECACLSPVEPARQVGEVVEIVGRTIESRGPATQVGDICEIRTRGGRSIQTQVIGFRRGRVLSLPFEETNRICLGDAMMAVGGRGNVQVHPTLVGRILNGLGTPIDDKPCVEIGETRPLYTPHFRQPQYSEVREHLTTGIRVIDGLLPCRKGQRIGIFGGTDVGKSALLGSLLRHSSADINVIALIGADTREVGDFLEYDLGPEGLRRSVVVATSDSPDLLRVRGCLVALALAEYFRDEGMDVLLVVDSVTRLAMAQREIGILAGESPDQNGCTPSVLKLLSDVFTCSGYLNNGSITAFFTAISEGHDFNQPVCEAVRRLVDGHITLAREMVAAGHYPAIQVLDSVSNLQAPFPIQKGLEPARKIMAALNVYRQSEDLIRLGAYLSGSNPALDSMIGSLPEIARFLRQNPEDGADLDDTIRQMEALAERTMRIHSDPSCYKPLLVLNRNRESLACRQGRRGPKRDRVGSVSPPD